MRVTCGCKRVENTPKAVLRHLKGSVPSCKIPYEVADAIIYGQEPRPPKQWMFPGDKFPRTVMSISALAGSCTRQSWLKNMGYAQDVVIDLQKAFAAFMGTAVHDYLAKHTRPGAVAEQRLVAEHPTLEDVLVTGRPDLVVPDEGLIIDWKTALADRSVPFRMYDSWLVQLQLYRWLWDNAQWAADPGMTKLEAPPTIRTVQWQDLQITRITREEVTTLHARTGRGRKSDPVDIWDDLDCIQLLDERGGQLIGNNPPAPPPGWTSGTDIKFPTAPLCSHCEVREACTIKLNARKEQP